MGSESGRLVSGLIVLLEQAAAVGGFFGHVVYSMFVGFVIVLRSFAGQFQLSDLAGLSIALFFCAAIFFLTRKFRKAARA
jgi:hypothetical protein